MAERPIAVVGAGGFGREALDVIEAINREFESPLWRLIGVFDDEPSELNLTRLRERSIPYLGPTPTIRPERDTFFVIGIGNPAVRRSVSVRLEGLGWKLAILIHPSSVIGSNVELGGGTVVCGGVQVSTNVRIGRHVHLNPSCTVGHDSIIEDFTSLNPGSVVSGEVTVERGSLVGAKSVVLQGLTVGWASVIGAGACVVKDVPPNSVAMGVPARFLPKGPGL